MLLSAWYFENKRNLDSTLVNEIHVCVLAMFAKHFTMVCGNNN